MPLLYDSQLRKGQADNFVVIVTTDCLQIIPTTSNQAQEKKKKKITESKLKGIIVIH